MISKQLLYGLLPGMATALPLLVLCYPSCTSTTTSLILVRFSVVEEKMIILLKKVVQVHFSFFGHLFQWFQKGYEVFSPIGYEWQQAGMIPCRYVLIYARTYLTEPYPGTLHTS